MNVAVSLVREQIALILRAWGMSEPALAATVEAMVETDLMGVDSHGISMLMAYEEFKEKGKLDLKSAPRIVRETAVTALLDGKAGLGHAVATMGMNLAVDKCLAQGVAVVAAYNSHHFGAAGYYARIAAQRGVIGLVTSSTRGVRMVPTFGTEPVLGTNPIAFAAPARRNRPFLLDMATTTVAANKIKVYELNGRRLPEGWVVDPQGKPLTDAAEAGRLFKTDEGGLAPVGGARQLGSHKGYGLAVMVHILAGTLAGGSFSPIRKRTQKPGDPDNIAHFFLAIDPRAFRAEGEFEDDLDAVIDVLHGTRPADPAQPVLVAGDPEFATREARLRDGIPIPDGLMRRLRPIAERAGVPFLLDNRR